MEIFRKLFFILIIGDKKKASLLLMLTLLMILLDTVGIVSVMPFMAILVQPELIETNYILNKVYSFINDFSEINYQIFFFILGFLFFFLLILSFITKVLTIYFQNNFALMREYTISKRLIEIYLNQPFSWFLNRNSVDLSKNILSEVNNVVINGILPILNIITQSILATILIIALIFVEFKLTLIISFTLVTAYVLIYKICQNFISRIGKERLESNHFRFININEVFKAIKEVKIFGLEKFYTKLINKYSKIYAQHGISLSVIGQVPRQFLELLAFGSMLLVIIYLMSQAESLSNTLPLIAFYAFACYRLLPALQNIYLSFTQIRFVGPALDKIYEDLRILSSKTSIKTKKTLLKHNISLNNINYNYSNSSKKVLKDINIDIPARTFTGIVGPSGSGKTTLVHLILGLIEPQKGTLKIDGQIINSSNKRTWQQIIGYVPQQIYIRDDTVSANIAFGVKSKDINQEIIKRVSKIAKIHDFIKDELPEGYQTILGDNGVRISGGQRQRIGIARALYHAPKVLILDEATSALDNPTEYEFIKELNKLGDNITIILIAHRLSTVKKCDKIFVLERGQIKGYGTYNQLKTTNKVFQKIVRGF